MPAERPTVLIVSLGSALGGAETHCLKLAKVLLREYAVVAVVCSERMATEFLALGVDTLYIEGSLSGIRRYLAAFRACRTMARSHGPSIAFLNGQPESYLAIPLWLLGLRLVTARVTPFTDLFLKEGSKVPVFLKRWICVLSLRMAEKTVCVSRLLHHQLNAYLPSDHMTYIPVWVEDELLLPCDRPSPSTPLRALFMGRIVRTKGIFDVIEAVRRCEGVHLTVAGEGGDMAPVQQLAEGLPINFTGFLSDCRPVLAAADLLIFASPEGFEGLPQVPLEAMAMGVPCLASNISSIREIADAPDAGPPVLAFFESGNIDDLTAQLKALAADPQRLAELGAAGRSHVMSRYTAAVAVGPYLQIFRDALE